MTLALRYPGADTRHPHYRTLMVEDALAVSSATEAVALVVEAIRKTFPPETARGVYLAIGAAAEPEDVAAEIERLEAM